MIARMVPRASLSSSVGATLGTNLGAAGLMRPWPAQSPAVVMFSEVGCCLV